MRLFPLSLAGCAAVLLAPGGAIADGIYKYVEKDGTIVYTNVPPSGKKAHRLRGTFHQAPNASEPATAKPQGVGQYDALIRAAAIRYRIPESLVRAVMHAESNFDGGARYLRVLANQYDGDMVKMLAAYNAGPDALKKFGGLPPFEETQDYVRKVLQLYFQYKEQSKLARTEQR